MANQAASVLLAVATELSELAKNSMPALRKGGGNTARMVQGRDLLQGNKFEGSEIHCWI